MLNKNIVSQKDIENMYKLEPDDIIVIAIEIPELLPVLKYLEINGRLLD